MADFGGMKSEIANEVNRTDVDDLIGTAIQTAILEYQENKVSFTSKIEDSISATASSENLTLPPDYFAIDTIKIIYGTNDEAVLETGSWTDMQRLDQTPGRPSQFAIFNGVAKLRAIPDSAYQVVYSYWYKDALPASAGDTNIWMTNVPHLIKWRAKAFLYADVLEDEQRGTFFLNLADREIARIKAVLNAETQSNKLSYN